MRIGFIGSGSMAAALAGKWAGAHAVCIGGRSPDKAADLAASIGRKTTAGSSVEAAEFGQVVVLATPHEAVPQVVDELGADRLRGKIILDITNPFDSATFLPRAEFAPSMGEWIQSRLPGARVVKAFNMCHASVWEMAEPMFDGRRLVCMYCGGDAPAKQRVETLIRDVGCEPLDLGGVEKSRLLEPAANIIIQLLFSGRDPHTVLNLVQPEARSVD